MLISELITLAQNKLSNLNNRKTLLFWDGDIDSIIQIDKEIEETEKTINKLNSI